MLNDIRKDLIKFARCLGDYQSMTCDELADGYVKAMDANDAIESSYYISALVLRFWYTIDKMYQKSPVNGVDREECYCWLVEAINYACKYRKWQAPDAKVNAQQCINQCIETIRSQHYYNFNLDKHKANVNTASLDAPYADDDDNGSLGETVVGDDGTEYKAKMSVEKTVQTLIDNKQIDMAIIADIIITEDCNKHIKETVRGVDEEGKPTKYSTGYSEFWPFKVVQILSKLPEDYAEYFSGKYDVVTQELDVSLANIRKANNQKLYKFVDRTLASLRAYYRT